jgi:hypothetical protein
VETDQKIILKNQKKKLAETIFDQAEETTHLRESHSM